MADVYLTSANVVTFNKLDMELMLSDVLDQAPVVARLAARTVRSNTFVYSKKTANPAVGFRAVNDGIENTVGTYTQVTNTLRFLDASFAVDEAAALVDERGVDHIMGIEAAAHLRQAMAEIEEQIFYGTTTGGQSTGFDGLANQANLNSTGDAQVVNATGTTANTGSSVWLLRTGEEDLQLLWGNQGEITIGERARVERAGSSQGRYWALAHAIHGWCGLKIGNIFSAVRICNLTADSGKGLTDALISQAIERFPASAGPQMIVMNRRSLGQLQRSRTATNPTGAPAPFPTEAFGVPVVVTDRILSTEALLGA
jgi:hypothetical protein